MNEQQNGKTTKYKSINNMKNINNENMCFGPFL